MEINIKKSIIEAMKKESAEGILNIIDDALSTNDDVVLPGVGVLFLIYWNNLSNEDKTQIAYNIKHSL